jgi:hypothetical protein
VPRGAPDQHISPDLGVKIEGALEICGISALAPLAIPYGWSASHSLAGLGGTDSGGGAGSAGVGVGARPCSSNINHMVLEEDIFISACNIEPCACVVEVHEP